MKNFGERLMNFPKYIQFKIHLSKVQYKALLRTLQGIQTRKRQDYILKNLTINLTFQKTNLAKHYYLYYVMILMIDIPYV